jgi:2-oxoglutarate dehydrogenase E1 component
MSSAWRNIEGVNQGYVLELFERYQRDPASVDPATREWFAAWTPPAPDAEPPPIILPPGARPEAIVGAVNLAQSIRRYGHLAATIDPLGSRPIGDPALLPETHRVTEADLRALPATLISGPVAAQATSMWDVIERLRAIYCSTTGYDVAHIFVPEERRWLREAIETGRFRAPADPIDPIALLDRLTQVEAFERFLHRSFPGKTRFSIEGVDALVPILDEVISEAAEAGLRQGFIAMAHRGRLNVMAHVLGKPYRHLLAEFKDPIRHAQEMIGLKWSGDVKYHLGASRAVTGGREVAFVVLMPPNPSHLEAIDPVLEGMARAAGTDAAKPGAPPFDPNVVVPMLIHGDASFPGQGVVAETLNLHRLDGYFTGGTIHIIANNQIGFTTDSRDTASTLYASGLARGFKIPIIHVNADDPEACVAAARLAYAYRALFKRDVLIDLVGYRRYGHNEGDEPSFTQPVMYAGISTHPTVREVWARTLEARGAIPAGRAGAMLQERLAELQGVLDSLQPERDLVEPLPEIAAPGTAAEAETAVSLERLRVLNTALLALPGDFALHRKLERPRERRRTVLDVPETRSIDWATAEDLAFASILEDGVPIRLTGEDVERGTFSQRHAVLFDTRDGRRHVPFQHLPQARASFEIHNSPLSENAAVGFEYGYNVQAPERLVIWEAQYGDFLSGAQVVMDEFVVSARAKWGQEPSLVFLLPHASEGQGSDHASARPERLLQMAADTNLRLVNCTTAAQYFHVLRRQAALLVKDPLPLVILTPKSLLRHPFMMSAPQDLATGRWRPVIDDEEARGRVKDVRRLILASGKVAVDLLTSPQRKTASAVAICRVEQLYPFPARDLAGLIAAYPNLEDVLWVQEEPENMGAADFVRPHLEALAGSRRWEVLARPRSSSPAEGSAARYAQNQKRLIAQAFTRGVSCP